MTKNQIEYLKALETERSNRANEAQTALRDSQNYEVAKDQLVLGRQQLKETHRSNLAKESETYRSNVAKERETHRSNYAQELLGYSQQRETNRSNLARERETQRSNLAQEQLKRQANLTAQYSASIQASKVVLDAMLRQRELAENERANLARESENVRSHREQENIDWARVNIYGGELAVKQGQLAQQQYSNYLAAQRLDEDIRHNRETERETFARDMQTYWTNVQRNYFNLAGSAIRILGR